WRRTATAQWRRSPSRSTRKPCGCGSGCRTNYPHQRWLHEHIQGNEHKLGGSMKALEFIAYIAAVLFTLSIAERWYSARRGDRETASHCATLDAIAVQTPEGWTC